MTYEEIKKANRAVDKIKLTHKDKSGKTVTNYYATVSSRIKAFRMCYPDGFIKTSVEPQDESSVIARAEVGYYAEDGSERLLGAGTALESKDSSYINKTSHVENAETSAVGRALGMAGFGIDTDVASAEEVLNAQLNGSASDLIDATTVRALEARCKADGVDIAQLCALYKVKSLAELTNRKHANIHEHWDKIKMGGSK